MATVRHDDIVLHEENKRKGRKTARTVASGTVHV